MTAWGLATAVALVAAPVAVWLSRNEVGPFWRRLLAGLALVASLVTLDTLQPDPAWWVRGLVDACVAWHVTLCWREPLARWATLRILRLMVKRLDAAPTVDGSKQVGLGLRGWVLVRVAAWGSGQTLREYADWFARTMQEAADVLESRKADQPDPDKPETLDD